MIDFLNKLKVEREKILVSIRIINENYDRIRSSRFLSIEELGNLGGKGTRYL